VTSAPPFFLIALLIAPVMWIYLILLGGTILHLFGRNHKTRIERPYATMFKATILSFIIYILISAPIMAANIAISNSLPFGVPYSACIFLACFVVFIQKINGSTSGRYQFTASAFMSFLITATLASSQYLLGV
jgi:hypothetical protein